MRIREIRESQGITQRKLATSVGITPAYLCDLEKGKRHNPSLTLLMRIAKELNVTVSELLEKAS